MQKDIRRSVVQEEDLTTYILRSFIFKYFSFSTINILRELVLRWQRTVKDRDIQKIVWESGVGKNYSSKEKFLSTSQLSLKSILSTM